MALAPRLAPGSLFARDYTIVELLAEGGMGAVYRAEQRSTRKQRALKLVSTRLASDPKGRERFVREATVGASIDSEHAVEVIGAGVDEATGRPWLAMELLDGADLGALVRHQGPLAPGQWREVLSQLCHGLAAAHRAGVVHRDLKPANVFVARSRRAGVPFTVKILDFGIAKVVQESGSGASETDTVGSPLWMAPEQLNAQRPTPATDVWALGLLAFWALTGLHYWVSAHAEASTVQALFVEQLFKPMAPPSERAGQLGAGVGVPDGFDAWFLRCTHRDAAARYPNAEAAGQALLARLPRDPSAAASLLPRVALAPSVSHSPSGGRGAQTTQTAPEPSAWEASAVVSAQTVAAARSSFEGASTHVDRTGLGADLSCGPLPAATPTAPPRPRVSPLAVTGAVSLAAGLVVGGGYLGWRWLDPPPTATAASDALEGPRSSGSTDASGDETARPDASAGSVGTADSAGLAGTSATSGPDPIATSDDGRAGPDPLLLTDAHDPLLDPVVPRRTQLEPRAHSLRFLGWSAAGHRFALEAEYRDDRDDVPNRLTLIQVHDALSGAMVESFLVSSDAGPGVSRYQALRKAEAEAAPRSDWSSRRQALGLEKQAPQRARPGGGELRVDADEPPPGTSLSFPPSSLGIAFRWSTTSTAALPPETSAPTITVSFERDGRRWPLLESTPPFSYGQLEASRTPQSGDPVVSGRILAYWSPDGARVVLLLDTDRRPRADPRSEHRRWALRAAGPQIRIVEAGAGQRYARSLAARLAAAGLPVSATELRAPPVARSQLIQVRRRPDAEALAQRVRAVIPELPEAEAQRRRRDFASVVLVLGHDASR